MRWKPRRSFSYHSATSLSGSRRPDESLQLTHMHRLKAQTAFRDAALTEPLACVVQGVEDCQLRNRQDHGEVINS